MKTHLELVVFDPLRVHVANKYPILRRTRLIFDCKLRILCRIIVDGRIKNGT